MKRIAAASIAVIRDGRFLLVKRGRGMARGHYAFPGGRAEPGESSDEAARRELFEETALMAGPIALVRRIDLEGADVVYELDVFVCVDATGEAVAGDDAETAGWYTVDEMTELDTTVSTLEIARELAASHCSPKPDE